jgi:hypothetical protein
MSDKATALEVVTLDGIMYAPGELVPSEIWLRLRNKQHNKLLNSGKVAGRSAKD